MMKNLTKLSLLLLVAVAAWHIHGGPRPAGFIDTAFSSNAETVSEQRRLPDFRAVQAGSNTRVFVSIEESPLVEVTTKENLLQSVETEVRNGTLYISRSSSRRWFFNMPGRAGEVRVNVSAPAIDELRTSGSSTLRMETGLQQQRLDLRSSGSSDLHVDAAVEELHANSSGSSDIHISGNAQHADIRASGSSDFRGTNFSARTASVRLSGSSDVRIEVDEHLSGRMSGSSDLHLLGRPEIDVSTSGSSRIRRLD